jgi:steroid 5-alpha reductase family enzyme
VGLGLPKYVAIAAGIQVAVFLLHGLPNRSEKFYDLSGSLTHFALVAASLMETRARSPRQILTALFSTAWMTRLGTFLFTRISRDGKDSRFDDISPVWLSFLGAWHLQAAWAVLTQLPVLLLNDGPDVAAVGAVDAACLAAWVVGFYLEFASDLQKFTFRGIKENNDKFISHGLWCLCRHPNYLGEIFMWMAMATCVSTTAAANGRPGLRFAWLSPAFTSFLLLCVSGVPLVEKAGLKKWGADPAYQAYLRRTPLLLPDLRAGLSGGRAAAKAPKMK